MGLVLEKSELDSRPLERLGAVYTKRWVVDLMLDRSGYTSDKDLASLIVIEPSAGDGSFVLPIVERLLDSLNLHGKTIEDAQDSILAVELDRSSAIECKLAVAQLLKSKGFAENTAEHVATHWVVESDFLLNREAFPMADLVIGNPPYVRLEDVPDHLAVAYRNKYPTMVGRADLYVAFFEAALAQLVPGGACSFICADRWMLNQYGSKLRQFITSSYAVETVIEVHKADPFQSEVSAYPAITVIRNTSQNGAVVARAGSTASSLGSTGIGAVLDQAKSAEGQIVVRNGVQAAVSGQWFTGQEPWPCYNPERLALLKRLEADFYPLESVATGTRVGIGVATGADGVFISKDPDLAESDRMLPMAMAKDIRSGHMAWSGNYLVNPWNGRGLVDLERFPRLKGYFEQHDELLKSRHVGQKAEAFWYRTIDKVEPGLLEKPKLYIADIKESLNPVLDNGETYPHHNLYFVQSSCWDHEVLGGIMLSRVAQFFIECYAVRMRGGYLRFQSQYLRRIRIPRPFDVSEAQAVGLRLAFQSRDRELATNIAFELYGIDHLPEDDY